MSFHQQSRSMIAWNNNNRILFQRFVSSRLRPSVPRRRLNTTRTDGTQQSRLSRSTHHDAIIRTSSSSLSSSSSSSFMAAKRLEGLDRPTVWHEFSPLARQHDAVNLGQGFPDWDPPQFVQEAMKRAVSPLSSLGGRNANQYALSSYAHPPLAQELVHDYTERWRSCSSDVEMLDPATQVATGVGCTEILYCALQGLVNPGDEVILLEPAFDIYHAQVSMAGGRCVFVPLRPIPIGDEIVEGETDGAGASEVFQLDLNELEAAITSKTKVLLLNTPHNPTGKMFSRTELEGIASIVKKHPHVTILSDEVYEHIVFDEENEPHISMATIPGMFDQTLTLSSSGKTFSCTGWKVGWAIGPEHLVKAVVAVQQWVMFSAPTPNQDAIAQALAIARQPYTAPENGETFPSYYSYLASEYKRKRQLLQNALEVAGMTPIMPPGGFFIMADTTLMKDLLPQSYIHEITAAMPAAAAAAARDGSSSMLPRRKEAPRDWAMSRWLTQEVGVTAIPPSAFYSPENVPLAQNLLRFAFCKGDDTILKAHERLEKYFST